MQSRELSEATRKRSPNFTNKENKLLAELVQNYEEQIECGKTNHASNLMKNRAWQELARQFNMILGGNPYRSAKVLKHRYDNIKKDIRRSLRNKERPRNGESVVEFAQMSNSSLQEEPEPEDDVDFKEIIRVRLMGDDAMDQEESEDVKDSFESFDSPTKQEPSIMPEPETDLLEPRTDNLMDSLKRNCFLEEHNVRMEQLKQKHNLEMELIRQEHRERIKMMKQEHEHKMELLELEKTMGIMNKI